MKTDVWIHRLAVGAISLSYLGIVAVLGALVLVLHDGEATRETVDALTQLGQWGLVALVFIATGRIILPPVMSLVSGKIGQAPQTGEISDEPATASR